MHKNQDTVHQKHIYYRIASSAAILLMHIRNGGHLGQKIEEVLPSHPEIKIWIDLGARYATVWNMLFQIVYSLIVLLCDITTVMGKESIVPKSLRRFRYSVFYGLIYPVGMSVSFIFWPYYLYDRELIFPKHSDLLITFNENLMFHGVVSLYVIFEMAFIPKESRRDDSNTLSFIVAFNVLYVTTMYYSRYVDLGVWPYDILKVTEGTIFIYIVLAHPVVTTFIFYFTQWKLQDAIWQCREKVPRKNE